MVLLSRKGKKLSKNWPEAIHPVRNSVDADKRTKISNGVNIDVEIDGRGQGEVEK